MKGGQTTARRNGFTLIEICAVMAILLLSSYIFLKRTPSDKNRLVGHAARTIRAAASTAIANARAGENEAKMYIRFRDERGSSTEGFLAVASAQGTEASEFPESGWIELEHGVRWGYGTAEVGPMQDPTSGARLPSILVCTEEGCEMEEKDYVTYYLTHENAPRTVYAIVVTKEGILQGYRYSAKNNDWTTEQR